MKAADISPEHFDWSVDGKVATVALNRPERKNPLTLESYAELRDTFRQLVYVRDIKAIIFTGTGENFCSGETCTTSSARLSTWKWMSFLNLPE